MSRRKVDRVRPALPALPVLALALALALAAATAPAGAAARDQAPSRALGDPTVGTAADTRADVRTGTADGAHTVRSVAAALHVPAPAAAGDPVRPDPLVRLIRGMTVEEKVGQLFVSRVYGDAAGTANAADAASNRADYGVDTAAEVVDKFHLGGVLYFNWADNANNPRQIAVLSNGLQRAATGAGARVPLLVTMDQEQGSVVRMGPPATQFPGNMALGASRSLADTFTAARLTGRELRAVGVNVDFAPDADVNVNPANPVIGVRSYGSQPGLVAAMTAAAVLGYEQAGGVSATAKHFPGHGATDVDSHYGFPVITHSRAEWERVDAPPFAAAVAAGVDVVMIGHLQFPALDPSGDPATLSRPVITGLLRGELGYDGLVVTDSLDMQGVRDKYGDDRVPVLAVNAGVDVLLNPPNFPLAYDSMVAAVRTGEISRQRLDEAVYRILRLKWTKGLFAHPLVDTTAVDRSVGTAAHLAAAERVADHTVTLLRNDGDLLPLPPGPRSVLVTGWSRAAATQPAMTPTLAALAEEFSARGAAPQVYETGRQPAPATIDAAVARARECDLTVITTGDAWNVAAYGTAQQNLVDALVATGRPVIVLAVGAPYDAAYLTGARTVLAVYNSTPGPVRAAARVIFGDVRPTGRLPVAIPAAGPAGTTLYPYGYGLRLMRNAPGRTPDET